MNILRSFCFLGGVIRFPETDLLKFQTKNALRGVALRRFILSDVDCMTGTIAAHLCYCTTSQTFYLLSHDDALS